MAADDDPKPLHTGTRFRQQTRTGGSVSPAYSNARFSATMTVCLLSPLGPTSSGMAPTPSPSVSMLKLPARSTLISFQMSMPMPSASKPGPMLAVVAGTRTTTRLRGHLTSMPPLERTRFMVPPAERVFVVSVQDDDDDASLDRAIVLHQHAATKKATEGEATCS